MSEPQPVRGVVVAHAEMARGLLSAVRAITGERADALQALSNDNKGTQALREELDGIAGEGPVVVFMDLSAGSCGMAALQCCRERRTRAVIGGVNLPMLLDFVFHQELPLEELAERLVTHGRTAIDQPLGR